MKEKLDSLEKAIISTVIFFDIFSRALKEEEIFKNLLKVSDLEKISFSYFKNVLKKEKLKDFIEEKEGFYFLKGKEGLIKERKRRERISEENIKWLEKIIKKINYLPFIWAIFLSGSLAIRNSNENSDIDLLIITKKNRIFMVRFLLTVLLELLRVRRKPNKIKRKICLNHYRSEDNLEIKNHNLYTAYSYSHLCVLLDRDKLFDKFKKENNWLKNYFLFWKENFSSFLKIKKIPKITKFLEKILGGSLGDLFEKKLKIIQIKRKKKNYPQGVKQGRVILEDNLIELFPNTKEEKFLNKVKKTIYKFRN